MKIRGAHMKGFSGRVRDGCIGALATLTIVTVAMPAAAQQRVTGSSVTLSAQNGAALEMTLSDGSSHVIAFEGGAVRVDGESIAEYAESSALVSSWREFLLERAVQGGESLGPDVSEWARDYRGQDAAAAEALSDRLAGLLGVAATAPAPSETATVTGPGGTELSIAPGGLAFDALTRQLEGLQEALSELGEANAAAADRLVLIVHDDHTVAEGETIAGNLALVGGELTVSGAVEGDILILNGTLILEPSGRVQGNILQVGGEVESLAGQIAGEILSVRPVVPAVPEAPEAEATPVVAPRATSERSYSGRGRSFGSRISRNVGNAFGGLMGALGTFIGLGALGLIVVYFARSKLEVVADTVRQEFGRSFAMGLAGEILFFPILVVLVVLVLTWLVLPFFVIAVLLALAFGYLAVAHAAGEMFANSRYRYEWLERVRRSNSYYYVLSGLALLLLPSAVIGLLLLFGGALGFLRALMGFAVCLATWILVTSGFGAVLLTRGGTRPEYAGVGEWESAGDTAASVEVEIEEPEDAGASDE